MNEPFDPLETLLQSPYQQPIYYFCGTEVEPLRAKAAQVKNALLSKTPDVEVTRVDGPSLAMDTLFEAAGSLSLFGTQRIIEIRELELSSLTERDLKDMASLLADISNAVLVVTLVYKDKKSGSSKKARRLMEIAQTYGFGMETQKFTRRQNMDFLKKTAAALGTNFALHADDSLMNRVGDDRALLGNEIQKLAAMCSYRTITTQMVESYGTDTTQADIFELAGDITARRPTAYLRLKRLLEQKNTPVSITAVLSGTFVDMYRVRCGMEMGISALQVAKDMGYTSGPYRLQKAKESADRYTTSELEYCLLTLSQLDAALKSSALQDKSLLLVPALAKLMHPFIV